VPYSHIKLKDCHQKIDKMHIRNIEYNIFVNQAFQTPQAFQNSASTCFQCDKKQVTLTVNPRVLHENCVLTVIFVSEVLKHILQKNI